MNANSNRDTIYVEDARIVSHDAHPGEQYMLRLHAPECAAHAQAGQFVHLAVDPMRPMRRPISIMRVDATAGWVDLLYKVVGDGTRLLTKRVPGETLSCLAPIGRPFKVDEKRPLLVGGGVGMPPVIFLADQLRRSDVRPLVILGSEVPFPFHARPSEILVPGMPNGVIGAMPLLEDWGIASRLASLQDYPGCFNGYVTDLARRWLDSLDEQQRSEVGIYGCGPHPMLEALVGVARAYQLPVHVSLQEFMACAVGGCAGCVVEVQTDAGPAMQRVCVDGPVFDGYRVFPG